MTFPQILALTLAAACFTAAAGGLALWWFLRPSTLNPQPSTPLHFVRTWKPLPPEQWAAAFRAWPETDPRWRAMWDLLCHHLEAELAGMESIGPDPHAIAQAAGRLQMLLFLRSQMLNLRK